MGAVIDSLYSPMTIKNVKNKNIDPRYFKDNGDGTFTPTPLLIRNIARDAEAYFKQRIFDLDDSNAYHSETLRSVNDSWASKEHDAQWKLKYGDKIAEESKRWHEYKDSHPGEFEKRFKRIAIGGENEARFFAGYSPDVKVGLNESIKSYNAARELSARFAGPNKDGEVGPEYSSLPFEEPLYSKEEFVSKHKEFRAKLREELDIPIDTFIVTKVEKVVPMISNKKCAAVGIDDASMLPFIKGLIKHITTSTAIEFKAKQEEMITLIDNDFIAEFNESAKDLKAVEDVNDSIIIYTKPTDGTDAIKLITIAKTEATDDNYKYFLSATSEDGTSMTYRKTIATKADLRKAMETSVDMLGDDIALKKYCADIKRAMEKL